LSPRIKQSVWKLVTVVAPLVVTFFCTLPGVAVAQGIPKVPPESIQSTNQYIDAFSTTGTTSQAEYADPVAGGVVTTAPSDSLWTSSQHYRDPEVIPAVVADESQPSSEASGGLWGSDLPPPVPGPEPMPPQDNPPVNVPTTTELPIKEAVSSGSTTEGAAASSDSPAGVSAASKPEDGTGDFQTVLVMHKRQLLGLAIIGLTIGISALMVWKRLTRRDGIEEIQRRLPTRNNSARSRDLEERQTSGAWATGTHSPNIRPFLKHLFRTRANRMHRSKHERR
jgi:hypothetical protein